LLLAGCAGLGPDAMSAFRRPGVPDALCAKVQHGQPLTLSDVITLSRAGVSDGAIIDYLYTFGAHFSLSSADADKLRHDGVSVNLVDYMTGPTSHPSHFDF